MLQIGKELWHHVKKFKNEHDMYRRDMNKFRDKIWQHLEWNDLDFDGFQSFYEFFFFSTLAAPEAPNEAYYLR